MIFDNGVIDRGGLSQCSHDHVLPAAECGLGINSDLGVIVVSDIRPLPLSPAHQGLPEGLLKQVVI